MEEHSFQQEEHELPLDRPEPFLNGSWERSDRSINTAVLLAFLGIGVLYFYGQSFLATAIVLIKNAVGQDANSPDGFFERLEYFAELQKQPIRIAVVITQYMLMFVPAVWLIRRWHTTHVAKYVRYRKPAIMELLLAVLAAIFFFPINVAVSSLWIKALHVPPVMQHISKIMFTAHSLPELLWLCIVVAVTPAICEEFLFRGYAQRTLERTIGWKSILVTGVVFGLYHFQPLALLTLSGMGFLLGFLYYRSRSLFTSMAAHFTNNFLALLSMVQGFPMLKTIPGLRENVPWWVVAACLLIECYILYVLYSITQHPPAEPFMEAEKASPTHSEDGL